MNSPKIRSALVISALALPLAAWGQAAGTTSTADQPRPAEQAPYGQERDMQRSQNEQWRQQPSAPSATSAESSSLRSATLASGDIKRVAREELDNRLTASDLIGKDVVGSDGEKIGTVKDISLAGAFAGGTEHHSTAAISADDSTRASSMTASTSSTATTSAADMTASDSSKDVIVYVAVGGVLGVGGDIVSVPASELRFDRQSEELRINRASTEITAIAQAGDDDVRTPAVAE